jgi:hypothetical protein
MSEKIREERARRALRGLGFLLRKDRARSVNLDHAGEYMIIDDRNCVVAGSRFDWSLDDVESFIEDRK